VVVVGVNAAGEEITEPVSLLCWIDGTVAEAWPMQTEDETVRLWRSDKDFKQRFNGAKMFLRMLIKQGKGPEACDWGKAKVGSNQIQGIMTEVEVAFVTCEVFAAHFHTPSAAIDKKVYTLPLMEGQPADGVFMTRDSVAAAGLPSINVKLYQKMESRMTETLLGANECLHHEHAKLMFHWQNAKRLQQRPQPLRVSQIHRRDYLRCRS
jgi:hypothetical protein